MYFVVYLRIKPFRFSYLLENRVGIHPEEKKSNSDIMQHFLLILYAVSPYKTTKAYILEFYTSIMAGLP